MSALNDTKRLMTELIGQLEELTTCVTAMQDMNQRLTDENKRLHAQLANVPMGLTRCAAILATFYRAPLSMSSVQPVLTLAEELNPELKS